MSKIRLHGSSSGYTEIAPVAASGNNTLTLPNDGTIISKDSYGAVGVTSITVGTGVTIGDGRITCTTLHGSATSLTSIPAANIVGVCTAGLTRTGGFGGGKIIQFQYGAADSGDHSSASSGGEGADVSGLTTSITLTSSSNKVLVMVSCNPYVGGSGAARYALKLFRDSTMIFEDTYANMRESDGTTKATRTSYTYLDNPADTSAHTYKVALKKESGSNTVYLFNEGANAHTISLYEVDVS